MKTKTRRGVLACDVKGHIRTWKKGTRVKARWFDGDYFIEREKRIPAGIFKEGLPLMNEMIGVRRSAIIFDP